MVTEVQKASMKRWYYAHREEKIAKVKEWYEKNREKVAARNKAKYVTRPRVMRERATSWYSRNKEKVKAYRQSEHYKQLAKKYRNPTKTRKNWLKQRYGMTPQEYDDLLAKQGGVCAICKNHNRHPTRWGNHSLILTVDHCHETKKIRGLLCHRCNAGLGFFDDDLSKLNAAIAYLAR